MYALVEAHNYDRALIMAYNADNPYPRLYGPKCTATVCGQLRWRSLPVCRWCRPLALVCVTVLSPVMFVPVCDTEARDVRVVLAVEDAKEAQAKAKGKKGKASVAAVDPRQVDDTPPFQVQTSQC